MTSDKEIQEVTRKIITFYRNLLSDNNEQTLVLADLYIKTKDSEGFGFIKSAAQILLNEGQKEKALVYYEYLLTHLAQVKITRTHSEAFLGSVLAKISLSKHVMPVQEQVTLLMKAEKIANRFQKWDFLLKIKHALGQALQTAGQHKKAFEYMNGFRNLAERIDDPRMLKIATLLTSEFLHWKGKYTDVIRRYEDAVEDLEEFENDVTTLRATARVGFCYIRCGRVARGMGMIDMVRAKADLLKLQQVGNFADLMTILAFFDLRKIKEAEPYLRRLNGLPEEIVGHYILWPVKACNAYICTMNGEYAKAFEYMNQAVQHSRLVGWHHHDGAWNFEYLDTLESHGFIHSDWTYDAEIKRILGWDDIYMKGIALRFRAIRNAKKEMPIASILSDLKSSEKYLKDAGAEVELARTRIELGKVHLQRNEQKTAHLYLDKAWSLLSKIDKNLFPKNLFATMPREQIEMMIDRVIEINESLGNIRDRSLFLEKVLNITMDFTMATRGAFFLIDAGKDPRMVVSRNLDPSTLKDEQFELIMKIVKKVAADGVLRIMPEKNKNNALDDPFVAGGIHSSICMPASTGADRYGYLYLDNRLDKRPFADVQLPYVKLLCNQIAVGLSNINSYEEMRESKDRYEREASFYKREMGIALSSETIVGKSQGVLQVLEQIDQVAQTDSIVLISGETGVGKELVAKAIHNSSKRKNGPFIPVNLAALPQELIASELFGHEKGAYTGAHEKRRGRFELAHGGTIFLDEIGDLPSGIQVNLLRVLQEGSFERLGSIRQIRSDFRVIAATNKDLHKAVENGGFRQDLYYRLNVFPIHVPPLRERKEDIALLVHHFVDLISKRMGKRDIRLRNESIRLLSEYSWPGNIRELEHLVERAIILSRDGEISFSDLLHTSSKHHVGISSISRTLAEVEHDHIEKILNATHWKVSGPKGAASILGLKPTTLLFRMNKLGIKKPDSTVSSQ